MLQSEKRSGKQLEKSMVIMTHLPFDCFPVWPHTLGNVAKFGGTLKEGDRLRRLLDRQRKQHTSASCERCVGKLQTRRNTKEKTYILVSEKIYNKPLPTNTECRAQPTIRHDEQNAFTNNSVTLHTASSPASQSTVSKSSLVQSDWDHSQVVVGDKLL